MATEVKFGENARERLLRGVDILTNAVKATLGPKGRTVLIKTGFGPAKISNDGVTVARSILLSDPVEAMGAEVVREAASRTGDLLRRCPETRLPAIAVTRPHPPWMRGADL